MSEIEKKRKAYKMAQKEKGKDRITTKDVEMAEKIIEARSKYQEDDAGEGYKGTPDMYPDYEEDRKELIGDIEGSMPTITPEANSVIGGAVGYMPYMESEDPIKSADDKAYMQSRGYNKGGSVSRGVGKAIRGTKFKGVF